MQATSSIHHPFPLRRTLAVMSAMAVVVMAVEVVLVPWLFGWPDGGVMAVLLMAGLVWISGMLSVLPMAREQGRGPLAVVKVFFLGMGVRAIVAVVAIIIAVKKLQLPLGPTGVATMMMYLPLLFVETRMLANYVQKYDQLSKNKSGTGGDGSGTSGSEKNGSEKNGSEKSSSGTELQEKKLEVGAKPRAADRTSDMTDDTTAPCTEALA